MDSRSNRLKGDTEGWFNIVPNMPPTAFQIPLHGLPLPSLDGPSRGEGGAQGNREGNQ